MSDKEQTDTDVDETNENMPRAASTDEVQTDSTATINLEDVDTEEEAEDRTRELLQKQQEQIEQLNDLVLDLSARTADNGGVGVCPDCNGPVIQSKTGGVLYSRPDKIECTDCGRVLHEYE